MYRRARKVFHPITKQYLGYVINRVGVVQVIQVDPVLVGVQVVRSYGPISPVIPSCAFYAPAAGEIASLTSAAGGRGVIVELQSDKHMSLVAQNNIVHLDKGRRMVSGPETVWKFSARVAAFLNGRSAKLKLSTEPYTAAAVVGPRPLEIGVPGPHW